jgi:hypothetical protein
MPLQEKVSLLLFLSRLIDAILKAMVSIKSESPALLVASR